MLPFEEPTLAPLRAKADVMPLVVARGRRLRWRRRLAFASPAAAAAVAIVLALVLVPGDGRPGSLRTVPADRGPTPSLTGGIGAPNDLASPTPTHRRSNNKSSAGATSGQTNRGVPATPTGSGLGPCVPQGTQSPPTPRTCYDAPPGSNGNVSNANGARGCVVHNAGANTAARNDFFCQYDAVQPGGYTASGPFNLLRITRHGVTFDVDGMAASTPRCQATGFIQPGDHVYVDGRNSFSHGDPASAAGNAARYGYTTLSTGDAFSC